MPRKIKDEIELYKDGNTYTVLINGWEWMRELFIGYTQKEAVKVITERLAEHFGVEPNEVWSKRK